MRDNHEAAWLRREGAQRAKRLNDNAKMARISRSYHIKTLVDALLIYVV